VATAIATKGLTKVYGQLTALNEVDLEVPEESIYALVGPNGAGKTTAFQILCTLLARTAGSVEIFGMDPSTDAEEVRRAIGYMPDFFGFYDDITVQEYLEFFAASYRIPSAARPGIASDLLDLVDLKHKADEAVESLSRGMKQRLGLARALVHDPEILILDEPASGLDPRARVDLRELLIELHRMDKTILISSHILSELEQVCTHIAVLEAGSVVAQGTPKEMMAEISGARAFRITLADPAQIELAKGLLDRDEAVAAVTWDAGTCEVLITGEEEAAAGVLTRLTAGGIRVTGFTEDRKGLEDLFMTVTKGIVQ
jgi:ABC-2 type transport system ATP-binding protein